ncbi:hypothetical protein ASF83_05845 [Plantibacter sp. Leaf171]|uniref:hypothetical protein n=1 Tax=unclassified Plantibacter TaxID=2624265 RepID=UPI0006F6040A|nr:MULTISPECIES: hypothetical protein [unclassified Plantibacter]KQM15489.1 hypothetical protein ASE44_05860 [Plantibacter sp. Leaf1]KQR58633.1 hypothetical protein ASF83_05845 [Plantibacter sp. Leaf171]
MTEQRDDDALSWAGDDDPTLDPSASGERSRGGAPSSEALETPAPAARLDKSVPSAPVTSASVPATPEEAEQQSEPDEVAAADRVPTGPAVAEREQMSSVMLVTLGIFGGVFLLYSVGWLISAFRPDAAPPSDAVGRFMFDLGQGLAVAAGPVWMAATLWLTRGGRPLVRIAMLLLGVLLILPWPFLRGV